MSETNERLTALEVTAQYERHARDQDRQIIMAHSRRLHHAETSIHGILGDGAKRDRKIGQLEAVAAEAKKYRDAMLVAKAAGKYLVATLVIGLYLSGQLSHEQFQAIRAYFLGS